MRRRSLIPLAIDVAVSALVLASPASAQQLGGGESIDLPFGRLALGLALCTLIAFVAAVLIRRRQGGGPVSFDFMRRVTSQTDTKRRVKILESQRLSPQADICRFVSADTEYLVIVSQGGATVLRETQLPHVEQSSANNKAQT